MASYVKETLKSWTGSDKKTSSDSEIPAADQETALEAAKPTETAIEEGTAPHELPSSTTEPLPSTSAVSTAHVTGDDPKEDATLEHGANTEPVQKQEENLDLSSSVRDGAAIEQPVEEPRVTSEVTEPPVTPTPELARAADEPTNAIGTVDDASMNTATTAEIVPDIVTQSQEEANVDAEASSNPVVVQEKSEVEKELLAQVPEKEGTASALAPSTTTDVAPEAPSHIEDATEPATHASESTAPADFAEKQTPQHESIPEPVGINAKNTPQPGTEHISSDAQAAQRQNESAIPTAGGERLGQANWGESKPVPADPGPVKDSGIAVASAAGQPSDEVRENTSKNVGSAGSGEQGKEGKKSLTEKLGETLHKVEDKLHIKHK